MNAKPPKAGPSQIGPQLVDKLLESVNHPLSKEIAVLRALIIEADPRIEQGIKWNSLSFYYRDWFATFNLRSTKEIQIILHTGAKVKASSTEGVDVEDPSGLLKWLAKDRCLLTLANMDSIETHKDAVQSIIRQWVDLME